ncbi:MAG: lytic transglycosylase domain-containing protein [Deltaproteobacteria bacterium]|nr:lytic transglycosylase domain-containing protein [Deltaproteobacteria bacterium]
MGKQLPISPGAEASSPGTTRATRHPRGATAFEIPASRPSRHASCENSISSGPREPLGSPINAQRSRHSHCPADRGRPLDDLPVPARPDRQLAGDRGEPDRRLAVRRRGPVARHPARQCDHGHRDRLPADDRTDTGPPEDGLLLLRVNVDGLGRHEQPQRPAGAGPLALGPRVRHRTAVSWLAITMLSCLSCSILPPAPLPTPLVPAPPAAPLAGHALPAAAVAAVRAALDRRPTGLAEDELDDLARVIVIEAQNNELDTDLVLAVMHVESRFNAFAMSPVGALGLMQIMPATGKELAGRYGVPWFGQQTLFDPYVNVKLGIAYLKELSLRYDSVPAALAAYNWGPGTIDGRLRRGRALPTEYPQLVRKALVAAQQERRS